MKNLSKSNFISSIQNNIKDSIENLEDVQVVENNIIEIENQIDDISKMYQKIGFDINEIKVSPHNYIDSPKKNQLIRPSFYDLDTNQKEVLSKKMTDHLIKKKSNK